MSNKIQILYFASLAEQAGTDEQILVISDNLTLGNIYENLKTQHQLSLDQNQLMVAKNHHMSNWHAVAQDGDVIAFIPPVAGG